MTEQSHPVKPQDLPASMFTVHESLKPWNMPAQMYLIQHQKPWDGIATGNVVFNSAGKVLLLQRASHDSMPNRWEVAGGAVDDDDPSIFYGAARELWEEAGLTAKHYAYIVTEGPDKEPEQIFMNSRRTKTFCRFTFVAEVENSETVRLDPNEHQDYVWAEREEVENQKLVAGESERDLPITNAAMQNLILEAFRSRTERGMGED